MPHVHVGLRQQYVRSLTQAPCEFDIILLRKEECEHCVELLRNGPMVWQ